MDSSAQPLERRWASSAGSNWRTLAATALLSSSRHQTFPSIGPGRTLVRNVGGSKASICLNLAVDSAARADKCARVGESCVACSNVMAWLRRVMVT